MLMGIGFLVAFTVWAVSPGTVNTTPLGDHWAWSDSIGWVDFGTTGAGAVATVSVTDTQLTGYASSSVGDISLDCATTRDGNICATSNYKVLNNLAGQLSGWGWNDGIGWISFCGTDVPASVTADCPLTLQAYRVSIDPMTGIVMSGSYAWNDAMGWVSFNCSSHSGCQSSDPNYYRLVTTWTSAQSSGTLASVTYDTDVPGGATINSILWSGTLPVGAAVDFQIATSTALAGPWDDSVFVGPGGSNSSYFPSAEIAPGSGKFVARVDYGLFNNVRYFRYKVRLISNQSHQTPLVNSIIVNWSP